MFNDSICRKRWEPGLLEDIRQHCDVEEIPLYAAPPAAPVVPDVWVSEMYDGWIDGYTPGAAFRKGWNDCRDAMLAGKEKQHD